MADLIQSKSKLPTNLEQLKEVKRITSHNGTVIRIFDDGKIYFVQLRSIAQAIGYSSYQVNTLLGIVVKNSKIPTFQHNLSTSVPYFIFFSDVFHLLERFLKANNFSSNPIHRQEEFDFNTKKLLEQFRKIGFCQSKTSEILPTASQSESEEKELESEIMAEGITTLTEADIEDIGKRANLIKDVFDVPKSAALQATVKLKAEEIGRNLAPLIELASRN